MRVIALILSLCGFLLSAEAAAAQGYGPDVAPDMYTADIRQAETYLRALGTVRADFIQKSSLGGRLSGTFYLDRPGKLRFEYNEVDDFIVADGFLIYFYDAQLQEQSNAPIGQTLADFLLRDDLRLSGDITVRNVRKVSGYTVLTISQTDDPGAGVVELVFSQIPYALKKWRVIDATGAITEVELKNAQYDLDLPGSLFAYFDPQGIQRNFNE